MMSHHRTSLGVSVRKQNATAANLALRAAMKKPHKYRAEAVTVDNIRFASKREAKRWSELKLLERAGDISRLTRQERISLDADGGESVGHYVADFAYYRDGAFVLEDAKGARTALYSWKRRHVKAQYKIDITEV